MKPARLVLVIFLMFTVSVCFAQQLDFNYYGAAVVKKDKNTEVYKKPDGTVITKYKDREEAILPEGTIIKRFAGGKREISFQDGRKTLVEYDGTVTEYLKDGKTKKISMDGKTPYGSDILEIKRMVSKDNFTVNIIYSAKFSDDNLNTYTTDFLNKLVEGVQKYVGKKRVLPTRDTSMVISVCRFCRTGYCRRKNKKEIEIVSWVNGKRGREISVYYRDILKKNRAKEFAEHAVRMLLK